MSALQKQEAGGGIGTYCIALTAVLVAFLAVT